MTQYVRSIKTSAGSPSLDDPKVDPASELSSNAEMQVPHRTKRYSAPRVPPELSDHIIDYLHADARALSACSLTCRDWLPRVRFNRFSSLAVDAISCQGLLRLLVRTPDIGTVVRNLAISYRTYNRIGRSPATQWEAEALAALLSKLPDVVRLELDTIDVYASIAHALQGRLPSVQALILTRVHVENAAVLCGLFLSFPRLQELHIADLFLLHASTPRALGLTPDRWTAPTLTTLQFQSRVLRDVVAPIFIKWLLSNGLQPTIDTFQITDVSNDDIPAVRSLLGALGPTLRRLSISFAGSHSDTHLDIPHGTLSLTHCTALRVLGLGISLTQDPASQERPLPMQSLSWVPDLLSSVSSPFLEHIHLRIKAGGTTVEDMSHLDWARVASVLAGHQFSSLRRLTFEIIRGTKLKHAVIPYIKERVAGLNRCARVRVRFLQRT